MAGFSLTKTFAKIPPPFFPYSSVPRWALAYTFVTASCVAAHFLLRGLDWESGLLWHTMQEVTGTALAAFVATLAFVRYSSQKNGALLLVATGFAGAAVLQGYHTLVTSLHQHLQPASPLPSVIAWSWLNERTFLALTLFLSYLSARCEARARLSSKPAKCARESIVFLATAILTIASIAIIALLPLPPILFHSMFVPRPAELLPAALFLLAFTGYWRLDHWKSDPFDGWLMCSLLTSALGQGLFMAFSGKIYDPLFDAAHAAKVLGYGMALTGLLVSIRALYQTAERSASDTAEANRLLRQRVDERDQAIAALQLDEQRLQALARLNEMTGSPLREITDFALEEAVRLTGSTIGYLAFLSEDETVLTMHSWSKSAMKECAIIEKPIVYPVASTGLWGEAVRQRKPVFTNNYGAPNPLKKGYPKGHVQVQRHMNIPVCDGDKIVAVAGVGNKETDYEETDVLQLNLLMTGMWQLLHRRQVLAELRALTETLEKRVEERTALADQRLRELERSNSELEQFAYVASHDLQEPLRMVASYTQLLARRYHGKLDQDADDFIRYAVEGATRMKTLINDLLAFSRVGRLEKPVVATNLNTVFERASADLQVSIQESGAIVTSDGLPEVMGDPVQLERLFQNLLANAVKFRGDETPRIHVAVEPQDGQWHLSVSDNGIGIPPECRNHVFQIFQRFHDRSRYPGNGIGLAMCKKIVSRHGGSMWVESNPGQGSTFHFTIPTITSSHHGTAAP